MGGGGQRAAYQSMCMAPVSHFLLNYIGAGGGGLATCPGTEGTELIYEGVVVGSPYNEAGTAE